MGLREWLRSTWRALDLARFRRGDFLRVPTCLCGHIDFDHDQMGCAVRGCNCVSWVEMSTGKMRFKP